jgi:hypothetical protein
MNELALCVEEVQRQEELLHSRFHKRLRKYPSWIAAAQIGEAGPHWILDQAQVIASKAWDCEEIECAADMSSPWVRFPGSFNGLVDLELVVCDPGSSVDLQCYVATCPTLVSFAIPVTGVLYSLEIFSKPDTRSSPVPALTNDLISRCKDLAQVDWIVILG